jgi:hypothetical protein
MGFSDQPGGQRRGDWTNDVDTADEVDAAFRSQRRAAITHFLLFGLLLGGCVVAVLSLQWWTESRVISGLSPGFVIVGGGFYVAFVAIAMSAATLANGLEDSMMGPPPDDLGDFDFGDFGEDR